MNRLKREIHYALRMLAKSPAFTAVAVLTLALGIGANTAMFSVIRAVMLKPLPYHEPDRLFRIQQGSSYPDIQDLKLQSKLITGIGGYRQQPMDLTAKIPAERIMGGYVTGDFFEVLGVKAVQGRTITPADDVPGGPRIVMLSYHFWKNSHGADPNIIGKSIPIAGTPFTIVGVLPANFELPFMKNDLYSPLRAESAGEADARGAHSLRAIVRLAPNVTISQAQSEFSSIAKRLEKMYPESNTGIGFVLSPWQDLIVRDVKQPLLILVVAVGFVLLIACTNVANLYMTRGAERQKEMAVRAAMGASRFVLMRQLLVEGVVLAMVGGATGLLFAAWISDLAIRLGPEEIPRLANTQMDLVVFGVTFGLSVLTGLLFSLVPGLHASKLNLEESLRETSRSSGSRTRQRLRSVLATLEVALAIVLLIGAGLLIRSFWILQSTNPGFRSERILTMHFTLPLATYADISKRVRFFEQVLDRTKSIPGVESVAATSELPFRDDGVFHNVGFEGLAMEVGKEPEIWQRSITPDYFATLGIMLLQGRSFTDQDRAGSLPVAIVNQQFAEKYYANENPLGKRISWIREENPVWMTIVGVVSDVKSLGLDMEEQPAIYTPFTQEHRFWHTWMNFVVRTSVDPKTLIASLPKEIATVDKNIPVTELMTMDALISKSIGERRFHLLLMGLFAGLALLLAGIGIYGILSYNVRQRTREMGIRMALGATRKQILELILGQGMKLAFIGAIIGIATSFGVTRFLRNLLYSIAPTDWLTFIAVPLLVLAVALIACYAPARRATRVNPIVALRYE
jgi:predicted permease